MHKIEIEKNALTPEQMRVYRKINPRHEPTGDLLVETSEKGSVSLVIFTGEYTHSVRDCGDHYIIARCSGFDRVDKETLKVTRNVEDR